MNIEELKIRLLERMPAFATAIQNADFIEKRDYETAYTDGKNIFYNPDFLMPLDEEHRLAVFANLICHIQFNDVERGKDKDQTLWNIATDAVINKYLREDGFNLVDKTINMKVEDGETAETLYEKLLKEKQDAEELSRILNGGMEGPKGK